MNPGLLDQQITLLRLSAATDELGQPTGEWEAVGSCRAPRMTPKASPQAEHGGRPVEQQMMVFRVRSQPFGGMYQPGDRLRELKRTDFPEQVWEIDGWAEVDGSDGMYVDVAARSALPIRD